MDVKNSTGGDGRSVYRASAWRRIGGNTFATAEDWIVEVQSDTVVATGVERIGCGRFRRFFGDGFINAVLDELRPPGL